MMHLPQIVTRLTCMIVRYLLLIIKLSLSILVILALVLFDVGSKLNSVVSPTPTHGNLLD